MKPLYLNAVELSNFRIYGDSYAYEFPPCPGVALITGANGMGKTSFFDAVEWGLTGKVSRFSDIPTDGRRKTLDPLTRIGAPAESHRVSLQFTDGTPIDRGAGFIPDEPALARLLKHSDWPEIRNLHGYLSITHFLGQAATRRFSVREPKDQWEALKGPAGVDRINALHHRISGQGTRLAFARALKERAQRLERAIEALQNWKELLEEWARAHRLASSEQPVSAGEVNATLERLAAVLLPQAQHFAWTALVASDEPELSINRFADLMGAAEDLHRQEAAKSHVLARLAEAFNASQTESAAAAKIIADVSARRAQTLEELRRAEAALAEATVSLTNTERTAREEQQRSVVLARVAQTSGRLLDSQSKLTTLQGQLDLGDQTAEQLRNRVAQLQEHFTAIKALWTERGILTDARAQARTRAQLYEALQHVRQEAARVSALSLGVNAMHLRNTREAQRVGAQQAAVEVEALTDKLRSHDERVRALSEAVSAIAHCLTPDDGQCPVCASQFPPGRLLELARTQISGNPTPAAELAAALVEARTRMESLEREGAETDRRIAEHQQLLATLAEHQAREDLLRQQLVESGGSADGTYNETTSAELQDKLDVLDQRLATEPSLETLQASIAEAEANRHAEFAKRKSLEQEHRTTLDTAAAAKALLQQYPELWQEQTGLRIDPSTEQANAEQRAATLGNQLVQDQLRVGEVRSTRDRLAQSAASDAKLLESINAKLDVLSATRKQVTRKWTDEGQSGEPSAPRVAQYRMSLEERRTQLDSIRTDYTKLVAGYRQWLNDQAQRSREQQMEQARRAENVATDSEVTTVLETRLSQAQRSVQNAQSARNTADAVGRVMQERAESFTGDVLAPLNTTIQRFARTLMTWSDASIIYRADHYTNRSELRPRILRTEPDGSTSQLEMNPNLYFSEGQLSALSVSALLAASTTFNWSRWRGLLLDDPLQHNDVIHASAFMDLLRQMVRKLGYQVILSTHDSAEADFLVRKCRNAGIPYIEHELVPRGEDGLVTAVA